jgi:hypothetical protein
VLWVFHVKHLRRSTLDPRILRALFRAGLFHVKRLPAFAISR